MSSGIYDIEFNSKMPFSVCEKEEFEKTVYTPKMSFETSEIIRRLAWSLNLPMTKALERLVNALAVITNRTKICNACKDKSNCKGCIFSRQFTKEEKAALLAAL
jgi:hypothetical protein